MTIKLLYHDIKTHFNLRWLWVFLSYSRGSRLHYHGVDLHLPMKVCPPSMRLRFLHDEYERAESYLIKKYMTGSEKVLELGGCIGYISCLISLLGIKNHTVLEINKNLIPIIHLNKQLNDAKFEVRHGTISDDTVYFEKSRKMTTGKTNSQSGELVPLYNLNELEEISDFEFNTLVCDIEGAEFKLLRFLDLTKFEKIFIEWHDLSIGDNRETGRQLLTENGFMLIESIEMNDIFKRIV